MTKIYRTPFASQGNKKPIPVPSDFDGYVADETGFTPRYELPKNDPQALPITREEMNGILNEITSGLGEVQQYGYATWQAGTWPKEARVLHNGVVYRALVQTSQQPPGANWQLVTEGVVQTTGQATDVAMSQKAVTDELNARASKSTTVAAGPGLVVAGDLSQGFTFSANFGTTAGTVAQGNDTRIVNAVQSAGTGLVKTGQTLGLQAGHVPIGAGQTWQNVSGSRARNTAYTNTTGRPIMVSVSVTGATLNVTATFYIGGHPVTWLHAGGGVGVMSAFSAIIPNGVSYWCNFFNTWLELR